MADVVGQAVAGREQPQREVPLVETRQPEAHNTTDEEEEEDDAEEEEEGVSCFKEVVLNGNRQLELPRQPQREVAVLMGDTPSPAPSVISIRSDLTDVEDEGGDEDAQRCRLNE